MNHLQTRCDLLVMQGEAVATAAAELVSAVTEGVSTHDLARAISRWGSEIASLTLMAGMTREALLANEKGVEPSTS